MKRLTTRCIAKWLLLFSPAIFTSCQKDHTQKESEEIMLSGKSAPQEEKYNTFNGDEIAVANGYAHTFITQSHRGVPQELGIVFTDEALSGLPTTNTSYVLDFHHKALESTPFKHLSLGWSANGHPLPGGAFMAPHFDIRFFLMTLEERLAMHAPPAPEYSILPPPGYMPANYFPDVPSPTGMNWTDKSFVAGVPVNYTMILGSYNGEFTFISPIVLRTYLASGASISLPWTQQQLFVEHGYYPSRYNIYQDAKKRHYVTLSDFVWR
jgi:hypothetical protein